MNRPLIAAILLLALLLSACASAATPGPNSLPSTASDSGGATANKDLYQPQPALAPGSGAGSGQTGASAAQTDRMVIKTASLIIVVEKPGDAMAAISDMANKMAGYVVTSNSSKVKGDNGTEVPHAAVTVRVPADKLDEALAQIHALVKNPADDIRNENVTGQDITKDYTNLQSRLTNLEATEKQLQRIQESATKTEDVLSVFKELSSVREQIEVIKGQMKYDEEASALSSISVEILASAGVAPLTTGGWQPLVVANNALQTLIDLGKGLAEILIYLVIVFLPLGLIVFAIWRLVMPLSRRLVIRSKVTPPAAKTDFPELK